MHNDSFNNPANTTNLNAEGQVGHRINVPSDNCVQSSFSANSAEHIGSGKYVSVQSVAARIARNIKGKEFDIYDVAEWCAEVQVDEIGMYEGFVKYRGVKVPVKHNKAYVPCNVYRILSVYRNECSIPKYSWDGAYLKFNMDDPATFGQEYTIELDYMGVAVDKDGFPLILDGTQEACYWYCLTKLYFEDYLSRVIDENRYMHMQERFGHYVDKAKSSFRHITRDDMNEIQRIMHNMVPKIKMSRNVD